MTPEKILAIIEELLKLYKETKENNEDEDIDVNNLVEFVGEDENWNWLYRFK